MARRRFNGKRTRELIAAIERQGGTVRITANQHLRVSGPLGIAVLGSPHGEDNRRKVRNQRLTLRREAGIAL